MIKFTLACEREHEFDSWFPDNASYEEQARRGFVVCPECNSHRVAKAPMAPAVLTRRRPPTIASFATTTLGLWRFSMAPSPADAFVFFGASGDLAYKKIFPALQAMVRRGHLNVPVIGLLR